MLDESAFSKFGIKNLLFESVNVCSVVKNVSVPVVIIVLEQSSSPSASES